GSGRFRGTPRAEGGGRGGKGPPDRLLPVIPAGRRDAGGTQRFALSPDRKKVALPRPVRKCYAILDTTTGQELGHTPDCGGEWGDSIAFSPDGARLAFLYFQDVPGGPAYWLMVADGTRGTGAAPGPGPAGAVVPPESVNLFSWWGPDLLVYAAEGGVYNVLDLATGQIVAKLKHGNVAEGGVVMPCADDGRLWVKFQSRSEKLYKGSYVCAFDPLPE